MITYYDEPINKIVVSEAQLYRLKEIIRQNSKKIPK